MNALRKQGNVKFFNQKKGFGFVKCGEEEFFIHHSHLPNTIKTLKEGQSITFTTAQGKKGVEAREIWIDFKPKTTEVAK